LSFFIKFVCLVGFYGVFAVYLTLSFFYRPVN
jgi:hypothetical protein